MSTYSKRLTHWLTLLPKSSFRAKSIFSKPPSEVIQNSARSVKRVTETEKTGALSSPPHLIPKTYHPLHVLKRDEGQSG